MLDARNQIFERLNNFRWEAQLNISTRGIAEVDKPDAGHYATIHYSAVYRVLRHLSLQPSDTFVDVGCGKGRILCCAARRPCRKVVGIDYCEEFCKEAQTNAARMRGRRVPVVVHNGAAEEFDYTEATALFFFSPFGASTLAAVLQKMDHDSQHRRIRLAFVNCNEEQDKVFARQSWLELYGYWRAAGRRAHSVHFYRRTGAEID
ncbi:class I SAM-dependent methyltransferase [Bradyrhizobium sp. BR 1432]|uniref:class I SAM-dependent methyltransferase n=1 Tax=Bradyrhizobium sp. BR 1432 TaxID=3447966 RepID=UPI003EE47EB4